ncbi:hypothetical protein JKF63_00626 [Porcisia hertigi]|uniref:ADF-H domain-containing protein n=1 Tax=Porcisia hertigi TaxID=2761500 RepID=A0A836KX90_9TRYP|nr:hypothetical protein JKF63_00626 [Porcisia hertigi]
MAMSGVTLKDEVRTAIDNLRLKKTRYVMMVIGEDGKQIEVMEIGKRNVTYADFKDRLSSSKPCYVAFDFEHEGADLGREKLILIQWIPDGSKPREKMLYSASRDALSSVSEGYLPIQANDVSALDVDEIVRKVKSHRSA